MTARLFRLGRAVHSGEIRKPIINLVRIPPYRMPSTELNTLREFSIGFEAVNAASGKLDFSLNGGKF
jgi:hypothetical protein